METGNTWACTHARTRTRARAHTHTRLAQRAESVVRVAHLFLHRKLQAGDKLRRIRRERRDDEGNEEGGDARCLGEAAHGVDLRRKK